MKALRSLYFSFQFLAEYRPDGFYKQRTQEIGPVFDLMVNLTNWWCGYKPNRVYKICARSRCLHHLLQ